MVNKNSKVSKGLLKVAAHVKLCVMEAFVTCFGFFFAKLSKNMAAAEYVQDKYEKKKLINFAQQEHKQAYSSKYQTIFLSN